MECHLKLPSLFIILSQRTLKWLPYILICHCTSLLTWFIILDNNKCVNVSHHLTYIRRTHSHVLIQIKTIKLSHKSNNFMFTFSFVLHTVIRPWLNLPTGCHGQVIYMVNLGGVFTCKNTPEGCTEPRKSTFFHINK